MKVFILFVCLLFLTGCIYVCQQDIKDEPVTDEESVDNMTIFSENDKYGYIDKNGEVFLPAEYDYVTPFENGVAYIYKNKLWGHILENGTLISPQYTKRYILKSGQALVQIENQGGIINEKGQYIHSLENIIYGNLSEIGQYFIFSDLSGVCFKNGEIHIIENYQIERSPHFTEIGKLLVYTKSHPKLYGLMDSELQFLLEPVYNEIKPLKILDRKLPLYITKNDENGNSKLGIADMQGNIIIDCLYDGLSYYPPYCIIKINGKFGIIDVNGNQIVECIYDELSFSPRDTLYRVMNEGKYGYINIKGEEVIPVIYDTFGGGDDLLIGFLLFKPVSKDPDYEGLQRGDTVYTLIQYQAIDVSGRIYYTSEILKIPGVFIKQVQPNISAKNGAYQKYNTNNLPHENIDINGLYGLKGQYKNEPNYDAVIWSPTVPYEYVSVLAN